MQKEKEINLNKLIEKICRNICKKNNIDPDVMICKMMPQFITPGYMAGFFVPSSDFQMPIWMMYREVAQAAYDELSEMFWLKIR